jgi:hypothetical protein
VLPSMRRVPYPFAHPAIVLPLIRPMGRFGVPSALIVGSMVPDAWYLFPHLVRADSHSLSGLFLFCLPLGFLVYFAFQKLKASPVSPWPAVFVSLLVGALTHFAWDGVTHSYAYEGFYVLQHASTILGSAFIVWWYTRSPWLAALAGTVLAGIGLLLIATSADVSALRTVLRSGGIAAAWIAAAAWLAWRLISMRATPPRAARAPSPRTPGRRAAP